MTVVLATSPLPQTDSSACLVSARSLTKAFERGQRRAIAVEQISLDIEQGDFVAIIGPSGSGKTTLLNLIGALDVPTAGSLTIDGSELGALTANERANLRNEKIGFVFQHFHLLPRMTAIRQVAMPLLYAAHDPMDSRAKAEALLVRLGLAEHLESYPQELSGGQQQRVAIARALINSPKLLLADEPTGALDEPTAQEILRLFGELNEQGNSIVIVTHDMVVAKQARRIIGLRHGKVERDERRKARAKSKDTAEVRHFARSAFVNFWSSSTTAFQSLRSNPLRSGLAALGTGIAVAALIVMVAAGRGARSEIDRHINLLGTNLLVINPSPRMTLRSGGPAIHLPLSESDVKAIKAKVPGVAAVSGQLWASAPVLRNGAGRWTFIWGVHEGYLEARNWTLQTGRNFTEYENATGKRVAIVGQTVVKALFGEEPPVGQIVRIRNAPFTVIGTIEAKGHSPFGGDQDDVVLVPMTTARRQVVGKGSVVQDPVGQVSIRISEHADPDDVQEEIAQVLRQSRRDTGDYDSFIVGNLAETLKARTATQTTLTWLLGMTAAISMVVGGIGIMNVLLVSISERTSEIGLRMAVGARRADILHQFLLEAAALSTFGALSGVVVGLAGAYVAAAVLGWPMIVAPYVILFAVAAAAATGLLFGLLPARRASRLNPIEALKSE